MVDLSPDYNFATYPHRNDNFLANVEEFQRLNYINIGFACIRDQRVPGNASQFFVQCYTGDQDLPSNLNESPRAFLRQIWSEYSSDPRADISKANPSNFFPDFGE